MVTVTHAPGVATASQTSPLRIAFPIAVAVLVGIALILRLVNITNPPGYDEGKYSQGLVNMSRGFRPFVEIFNPQGPLFYPSLYPFFRLGGGTLEAARIGSIFWSMVGLGAIGVAGWLLAGRVGTLIALLLLCVSPQYLAQGRVIQSEAGALGLALPAVALALAGFRAVRLGNRRARLYYLVASIALALSFSIKALTLGTAVVLFLAVVLAPNKSIAWRSASLLGCGIMGALVLLIASAPFSVQWVWEQSVLYHAALKAMQGPELDANLNRLIRETAPEGFGLILVAVLGTMVWLKHNPRVAIILLGWAGSTAAVLMTHSPLLNHHMVVLVPPLVLLGVGLAAAPQTFPRSGNLLAAVGAAGYLLSLPTPMDPVRQTVGQQPPHQAVIDAGKQISAVLEPDDFLVTDHPYAATLAQRATPPELADADKYRLESGWLTSADLVRISEDRGVKAALLWLGIYERAAPEYVAWLQERFFPLWSSEQPGQVLYVRKDIGRIDVSKLPGYAPTPNASFGSDLDLLGYAYPQQALAGSNVDIRMIWRATSAPSGVFRVIAAIVNEQEQSIEDATVAERWRAGAAIGEPGQSTERWTSGDMGGARLRLPIPSNAAIGRHRIFLGLQRPDGTLAATQALESDGKPRRSWNGMMFLTDLNIIERA
jgi:hypothetical protein